MAIISVDLRGIPMMVQVVRAYGSQDGCKIYYKAPLQAIKMFIREDLQKRLEIDL